MKRVNPMRMYGVNTSQQESQPMQEQECVDKKTKSASEPPMMSKDDILKAIRKYHATLMVVSNMVKAFHYTCVGDDFYSIHARFEDFYKTFDEYIDSTAELLVMVCSTPVLTLSEAIDLAGVDEYIFSGCCISCSEAVREMSEVFSCLKDMSTILNKRVDAVGIPNIFQEHLYFYYTEYWKMKAYLQED